MEISDVSWALEVGWDASSRLKTESRRGLDWRGGLVFKSGEEGGDFFFSFLFLRIITLQKNKEKEKDKKIRKRNFKKSRKHVEND